MPNVLVFGATGYIGGAVASSLVRSGYTVFGLARTEAASLLLASQEITPVLGSFTNREAFLALIASAPIDVVVNCAEAASSASSILQDVLGIAQKRLDTAAKAGICPAKLGYVYVSGTWVHGSSLMPVNDLAPVASPQSQSQPGELVRWRAAHEQEVLAAKAVLNVIVVRPALVYGRQSNLWPAFFEPIVQALNSESDIASIPADPQSHPGLIHIDDVATGIHQAVEKLPQISGSGVYPIFDLFTSQEPFGSLLQSAARALGYKGKLDLVGPGDNLFLQAMNTSFNGSSARATQLLGWQPKKVGLSQGISTYIQAFIASKKLEG